MKTEIIKSIETALKALPWVERYGGLVRVARKITPVEGGDFTEEAYPVSCDTTGAACWEQGKYIDLVPDDSKKSVCYFEEISSLSLAQEGGSRRNMLTFSGSLRFVAWFNLNKLGYDTCNLQPHILGDLINLFQQKIPNYTNGELKLNNIIWEIQEIESKDPGPFESYSYYDRLDILLHPYDFISLVLNIQCDISKKCLEAFALETPIDC